MANRLDPPTGRSQLLRHYSPLGDPSVSLANVVKGPRPRRQGKTVNVGHVGPTPSRHSAPGEESFVFSRSPSGASPPPLSSPLDRVRNAPRTAPTRIRFMEKNDREVIKNLQAALASPKFSADDQKRVLLLKKTKLEGRAAGSQGDALEAKKQALLKEKADATW